MSYETDHNVSPTEEDIETMFNGSSLREMTRRLMTEASQGATNSDDAHSASLATLLPLLEVLAERFPDAANGVGMPSRFIDSLDRVPKRSLKPDDSCPVCATKYSEDDNPLVVSLPCPGRHRFDLECVTPWLQRNSTCPMCRHDFNANKKSIVPDDDDEEDEDASMFG